MSAYERAFEPELKARQQRSPLAKTPETHIQKKCFKTKMCTFFIEGKCTKGDSCSFAHDSRELNDKPDFKKTRLCVSYSQGQCNKTADECDFAHGTNDFKKDLEQVHGKRPKNSPAVSSAGSIPHRAPVGGTPIYPGPSPSMSDGPMPFMPTNMPQRRSRAQTSNSAFSDIQDFGSMAMHQPMMSPMHTGQYPMTSPMSSPAPFGLPDQMGMGYGRNVFHSPNHWQFRGETLFDNESFKDPYYGKDIPMADSLMSPNLMTHSPTLSGTAGYNQNAYMPTNPLPPSYAHPIEDQHV